MPFRNSRRGKPHASREPGRCFRQPKGMVIIQPGTDASTARLARPPRATWPAGTVSRFETHFAPSRAHSPSLPGKTPSDDENSPSDASLCQSDGSHSSSDGSLRRSDSGSGPSDASLRRSDGELCPISRRPRAGNQPPGERMRHPTGWRSAITMESCRPTCGAATPLGFRRAISERSRG